jgi:hypothetical protein
MRVTPLIGIAAATFLAACPDREVSELTPGQGKVEYKDIPVTVNRDLDLLFVIDNSGSMGEEQDSLRQNFPKFIEVLETIQGGLPNVHIGVINSDMGTLGGPPIGELGKGGCAGTGADGVMRPLPGQPNERYISDFKDDVTGVRTRNYPEGQLAQTFRDMASVGTGGCGFEMHLDAMRRSLENPANAGFLRPDAYLAVIFIADEDDCSLKDGQGQAFFSQPGINDVQSYACFKLSTICDDNGSLGDMVGPRTGCKSNDSSATHEKISAFVNYLKSKKADPDLLIVGGIIGNNAPVSVTTRIRNNRTVPDVAPSCTYQAPGGSSTLQRAAPGVRLTEFLDQFNNSTTTTICKSDLSDGLLQIAELLKTVIGSPCINNELAIPYQCSVLDVQGYGKPEETRTVIGQCEAGVNKIPCWSLGLDAQKCGTKLALNIERGGVTPPDNTHVIANCVTK